MDALLRRAAGRGVLVGDSPKKAMDADAIAAFAENALPEKSRMIYTQHLAVCDPCRTTLARLITLNAEAEPGNVGRCRAGGRSVGSMVPELYSHRETLLTRWGALVLVFGGLLDLSCCEIPTKVTALSFRKWKILKWTKTHGLVPKAQIQ
jgi:hypothetical protein